MYVKTVITTKEITYLQWNNIKYSIKLQLGNKLEPCTLIQTMHFK